MTDRDDFTTDGKGRRGDGGKQAGKAAASVDVAAGGAEQAESAERDEAVAEDKAAERAARRQRNRAEREARQAANREARAARKGDAAAHPAPVQFRPAWPGKPRTLSAPAASTPFNILAIGQSGRLEREAVLLASSLRHSAAGFAGRLIVAEPQPSGAWETRDVRMSPASREALQALGADIVPLHAREFGRAYPHGNKIEALSLLPAGEPFLFLDSDTVVTGALDRVQFDFARPTASMRREGTWPEPPLYGPGYEGIWRSLYDRFGLDFASSLDPAQPDEHWERYLYFNAGWFSGPDPAEFGRRFLDWSREVRNDPGEALATQELVPWLDQVVLPLVVHSLGGGRPGPELAGMDGDVTWHYRRLPLLYASGPDSAVETVEALARLPELAPVMADWDAWQQLVVAGNGRRLVRPLFDRDRLPKREQAIRQTLRANSLWFD